MRLRGSYAQAEEQARLAAEDAYARAHEFGFNPQPGLSLLRLAQGKAEAAASGVGQALAEAGGNRCLQVRLRAAQGDPGSALPDLRRAQQAWQQIDAPHEVAELRLQLAHAHRALGDDDAARMEARAARDTLERLGARPAAERAAALLGELAAATGPAERVGRTFMFTDIVRSTDLVGVIGDEAYRAARIAALAEGGEILVSQDTLDLADGPAGSEARQVTVKGFPEPVS